MWETREWVPGPAHEKQLGESIWAGCGALGITTGCHARGEGALRND